MDFQLELLRLKKMMKWTLEIWHVQLLHSRLQINMIDIGVQFYVLLDQANSILPTTTSPEY